MQGAEGSRAESMLVYPSPATTMFTVELSNFSPNDAVVLYLYNMQGKEVVKGNFDRTQTLHLNVGLLQLNPGVYFVKAVSDHKVVSEKLVVVQ